MYRTIFFTCDTADTSATTVKDLSISKASWEISEQVDVSAADVVDACVWDMDYTNKFTNVVAGSNVIYYSDDALNETKYSLTLPVGPYSWTDLNDKVQQLLAIAGVAPALFNIYPDSVQDKEYFVFSATLTGWYVHMAADSPNTLLGTISGTNYPASQSNIANEVVYCDNVANFSIVKRISIKTNLSSNLIVNGVASSILYTFQPAGEPGYSDTISPPVKKWANANVLKNGLTRIEVQLLDQVGDPIESLADFKIEFGVRFA